MRDHKRHVGLIGAPTDVGAAQRGASMGPEALRVAGIQPALERLGRRVEDLGNLQGPANPEQARRGEYRHLDEVTQWCAKVHDSVAGVLERDGIPILLGGDHSLAFGSIAAVARHCQSTDRSLAVLWLDAHADFNVPESSPTGNLHGMPVALLRGHGPDALLALGHARPIISAKQIIEIGVRSVDEIEKRLLVSDNILVYDMRQVDELRMRGVMERALTRIARGNCHLHVSFDVDFLDPGVAPGVPTTVPGGPTYREAQLCMEMIHDTGLLASLDIMELNPACDVRNCTAELVVELVESLFGEQILARAHSDRPRYGL